MGVAIIDLFAALRDLAAKRREQGRLDEFSDRAFRRYFEGEVKTAAAAQVAANRANYHSAELESAEIAAVLLLDEIGWTGDVEKALAYYGVEPERPCR